MARHKWTELENRYLRRFYPRGDVNAIAARIGVSVKKLYNHARQEGFKRDPELVLEKNRQLGKALADKDMGRRFVKGQVSHNTGRKMTEWMSAEKIERTKATRFNKGNIPQNRVPIGYERITKDGYIEVKVADGKKNDNFELKQRLVWQEHNGPIPEGCIIEFVDGDKRNFNINNLRCVTRVENLDANRYSDSAIIKRNMKIRDPEMVETIKQDHPHLVELKRGELKLKRKLNELSRKDKPV